MIEAINLTKKFGDLVAVNGINLKILPGEIYGFLGPNGAGKTTTIKMLTGILKPTFGKVRILGMDMDDHEVEIKRSIGIIPDEPKLYPYLKGYEFLNFITEIFREDPKEMKRRIEELCDAFDVNFLDKYISEYSHGMKQKLMIISVFMRKPKVIFLDEPTVGLDAKAAKILKLLLKKMAKEGTTIFMTTHILEIAEKMCDRIGIIDKGNLIAEGTLEKLRKMEGEFKASLEDLFLKLTGQGEEIERIVKEL
ncbi:MAG TPA: ABC transporter ATP-binding protein [Thermotoga sp.]|nr:ABC transporter ATP-binding protein [Thermotoga sp.]